MFRYLTAGESHGKGLTVIIEGFPAGVKVDENQLNEELRRRQSGYGRGGRMSIEKDRVQVLSGIRGGITIGSPITFFIENLDHNNWKFYMDPWKGEEGDRRITRPRPGHADLPGGMKYRCKDLRNILERSSARETAARVVVGALSKQLLEHFKIHAFSHVISIGGVSEEKKDFSREELLEAKSSPVFCCNKDLESKMIKAIEQGKREGDSLGGIFQIHVKGVPVGIGSHVQWDRKIDGLLTHALMSIQGIKGVEIGEGFEATKKLGSAVHDEIFYQVEKGYYRKSNRAGGIEGGITTGEDIILRCGMKPIPTLVKPLESVDIVTKQPEKATFERSDVCAVPAASVVGEMVALTVIAQEMMVKFGQDSLEEMMEKWQGYTLI